jgi:hypothetical protein
VKGKTMKVKDALNYGKISTGNSKMPGTTFAIDAFACITGSKLAQIEGTPCYSCYARKLQKLRPSVDQGWKANLAKWEASDPMEWIASMVFQIARYNTDGYHRWFDSGDLQSLAMLDAIAEVARMTPHVRHWLPTQERKLVSDWLKLGNTLPDNLNVRVSAAKLDGDKPTGINGSQVYTKGQAPKGYACPARTQGNNCGDCRACWSRNVPLISYPKH